MLILGLVKDVEQILKTRLVLGLYVNLTRDLIFQALEPGLIWVNDLILIIE